MSSKDKYIIKILLFILTCLPCSYSFAEETMYISDELTTSLRKGAGSEYKVVTPIQSGAEVTVLDKKKGFYLVKDNHNRKGWIAAAELSSTPDKKILVATLSKQIEELKFKLNNIDKQWEQNTKATKFRIKELEKQNSQLLEENTQLQTNLKTLKQKNENLNIALDHEMTSLITRWFVFGGSVLGAGVLLGLLIPALLPKSRRSKKYDW